MKSSMHTIKARREKIVATLKEHTQLSVKELAEYIGVSEITIRRDLIPLEKMGLLSRSHGSASFNKQTDSFKEKNRLDQIKEALAKRASEFIKENDTVFINTSLTALSTVKYIGEKRVNIITNNVKVINFEPNPNTTIILSGGEVRFPKESLVGDIAIDSFSKMSSNLSIIGCSGINIDNTITTPIFHESKINSLIVERTNGLKIVVADYRKIGQSSNFISAQVSDMDYLITDCFADVEVLNEIEKKGVQVIQVEL